MSETGPRYGLPTPPCGWVEWSGYTSPARASSGGRSSSRRVGALQEIQEHLLRKYRQSPPALVSTPSVRKVDAGLCGRAVTPLRADRPDHQVACHFPVEPTDAT